MLYLDEHRDTSAVGSFYQNCTFLDNGEIVLRDVKSYGILVLGNSDFLSNPIPFGHGEVMFRRDLYNSVGGYRQFFRFAQDHDLWLRMSERSKMAIIPKVLYQRGLFAKDGIATNVEKLVLQKMLSNFAIQCFKTKDSKGQDLVDKYGCQAGLLRKRNSHLANFYSHHKKSLFEEI